MKKSDSCRLCAALAYALIYKAEEGWLMIVDNVPQKEKLIFSRLQCPATDEELSRCGI